MIGSCQIVGVLNLTPDSYVPESRVTSAEAAAERAGLLLEAGADIIELGGESTGPGSKDVSVDEELKRVLPSVLAIKRSYPEAALSIDTYKAEVARQALEAGASMINDVTAGRGDPDLFAAMASFHAPLVLMYAKDDSARTTNAIREYDDVIATITDFLRERIAVAKEQGITAERIIVDPGLGHFVSSDPAYSFEILQRLPEVVALGYPVLVSPSRKSFLAGSGNLPVADRLPATVVASALAMLKGARYIRTHDVAEVRRGCEAALALRGDAEQDQAE